MECPEAAKDIEDGDIVSVDVYSGVITNITKGKTYQGTPFPEFMQDIMKAGGLMNYVKGKGKQYDKYCPYTRGWDRTGSHKASLKGIRRHFPEI